MNLGKRILKWCNRIGVLCFLMGHTENNICRRCGKIVSEPRYHLFKRLKAYLIGCFSGVDNRNYVGSLKVNSGMTKYELDVNNNQLYRLSIVDEHLINGTIKRKAVKDNNCIYIDAINDTNALKKSNKIMRELKNNVVLTQVTKKELTE